ncbi:hypothetical protein GGR52DRAFT_331618 [Hypoxylon sp. FL1284]|nr:hypothetical protein GGR52DRAFT_331618 [Hypoxylon sp. FL1284]
MARSTPNASFLRLPPATAVLLLSAAFGMTSGHALPRQTKTVELHDLNVVPFPPRPTDAPILLSDLLRRETSNTVCGYIGGNTDLPATCQAGSHCVLEQDHGVVGCCPDGVTCQTGIYTGCVDLNSGAQTESNPYVYTCQGSDVCYRNDFAGGYIQYGCGTASSVGTTVETSVDGMTSLVLETTSVPLTAVPSPLSDSTTVGSQTTGSTEDPDPSSSVADTTPPSSSATDPPSSSSGSSFSTISSSSQSSSSSSSSSSSPSSSSTTRPSSTIQIPNNTADVTPSDGGATESPTDTSAPATDDGNGNETTNRGAIIGGSVSGAIVFVALLVAALLLYLRRRRRNNREGPGPLPSGAPPTTEYISPIKSHGAAFAPLPSWQDDEDDRRPLTQYNNQPYYPPNDSWQPGPAMAPARTTNTSRGFSQPLRYPPAAAHTGLSPLGVGTGLAPVAEEEQQQHEHEGEDENDSERGREHETQQDLSGARGPAESEIDDFSRAYSSAGIGSQEADGFDRQPLAGAAIPYNNPRRSGTASPRGSLSPSRGSGGAGGLGNRPLWQQNRQQGRNMMWL